MKLYMRFLVSAVVVRLAQAVCNTCSSDNQIACVANDYFRICTNGVPTSIPIQCASGTFCSETGQACTASALSTPACGECSLCNNAGTFACISYNTFTLCSVAGANEVYTCPNQLVCNVNSTEVCVDPNTSGLEGTCPSIVSGTSSSSTSTSTSSSTESTSSSTVTTTTSTTPNPVTSPQAYCANRAQLGRYDIATDTTCKTYIFCSLSGGRWIGAVYTCPGSTMFNPSSEYCTTTAPPRCA